MPRTALIIFPYFRIIIVLQIGFLLYNAYYSLSSSHVPTHIDVALCPRTVTCLASYVITLRSILEYIWFPCRCFHNVKAWLLLPRVIKPGINLTLLPFYYFA